MKSDLKQLTSKSKTAGDAVAGNVVVLIALELPFVLLATRS